MDRTPFFMATLILLTVITSSLFLSYAVDQGLGDVIVNEETIESDSGRNVTFTTYSTRYTTYQRRLPVVITIQGASESASDLYAFNIELARRNLTVLSVNIPMYDSAMFSNEVELNRTVYDYISAIEYVQSLDAYDDSIIGILSHEEGFTTGFNLLDHLSSSSAMIHIGNLPDNADSNQLNNSGNFLFMIGENNALITSDDALATFQEISGVVNAEEGITYGSIENHTSYRMSLTSTSQHDELTDSLTIAESCMWMVLSLQGSDQISHTLNIYDQIYQYKVTSEIITVSGCAGLVLLVTVGLIAFRFPQIRMKKPFSRN